MGISKTADLQGFSHTTISRVYREWSKQEKLSSEGQLCGRKYLVDVRGQRRIGRLVRDDRKATLTLITTRYKQGMQNTISERTITWTLFCLHTELQIIFFLAFICILNSHITCHQQTEHKPQTENKKCKGHDNDKTSLTWHFNDQKPTAKTFIYIHSCNG